MQINSIEITKEQTNMADKNQNHLRTTSSISLDDKENEHPAITSKPNGGVKTGTGIKTLKMTKPTTAKLSPKLEESYQLIKQQQQKYFELSARLEGRTSSSSSSSNGGVVLNNNDEGEWQQVKNKLKRKKKLSTSLTSVSDAVNQEKRTRIEGIQLNCRGKLRASDTRVFIQNTPETSKVEIVSNNKQPLTPVLTVVTNSKLEQKNTPPPSNTNQGVQVAATPPPRLKRKLQENVQTIQKLNALTEQLRLEINELKSNLITERGAVRTLRAQNESETRKFQNQVKKLQHTLDLYKKNNANNSQLKKSNNETTGSSSLCGSISLHESLPHSAAGSLVNYEIQRLTNEINLLKEANKALEEKKVINCDADRRKAADMRTLKDTYEIRLTQLKKSAKIEITRLLEEIKTKERNIGQLKKDLQILQNTKSTSSTTINNNKGKIATTKNNQTTNNQTTIKKPKKPIKNLPNQNQNQNQNNGNGNGNNKNDNENHTETTIKVVNMENTKDLNQAQISNEITKLNDIELINNKKNIQKIMGTTNATTGTGTVTVTTGINATNIIKKIPSSLDINTRTVTMLKEYHSLPHELELNTQPQRGLLKQTTASEEVEEIDTQQQHDFKHHHHHQQQHQHQIYRTKDNNNSDSDSALSSAPPSISPQPPPAGLDSVDIWQTIRTYTQDIEKLQKEIEQLHKENERLKAELIIAKDEILQTEKCAMEAATANAKLNDLNVRIKRMEEQEHHLQSEANELREQNELLEFRILELEETNDKWSLQSNTMPSSSASAISSNSHSTEATNATSTMATAKDVWSCNDMHCKEDPMQMLFGNTSLNMDSGITSPHSLQQADEDLNLEDSHEDLCRRLRNLLKNNMLEASDKLCLQQLLNYLQHLELNTLRSGPESLNANSSSDEPSSLEMVKSRVSDYSSESTGSCSNSVSTTPSVHSAATAITGSEYITTKNSKPIITSVSNCRIVATVQPYNSCCVPPTNTPTDSPRKTTRPAWQSNSLSESGVFVESDFIGGSAGTNGGDDEEDVVLKNTYTQTDLDFLEDSLSSTALQRLQRVHSTPVGKVSCSVHNSVAVAYSTNLQTAACDLKRLQYYKERLELLEGKVLIYESSGDAQVKHLANRLQREIHLEKQLKELYDRVDLLETENSTLEEEKCEFEEAENDTRLRLQRLEIELEILTQRNVELELSKEALTAKYKDCRSESLNLHEDLIAYETQISNLEADKKLVKKQLESLLKTLPLILVYKIFSAVRPLLQGTVKQTQNFPLNQELKETMGNELSDNRPRTSAGFSTANRTEEPSCFQNNSNMRRGAPYSHCASATNDIDDCKGCDDRELAYLRDEVKNLRNQMKDLSSRHYEAMETADSHWVQLEQDYKQREEAFRAKEVSLKQKISKLQDCLRDDARAANEKIVQLEETEQGLKTCLVRISKEHREILEEHNSVVRELESYKEQRELQRDEKKPLMEALDTERRRCKSLIDELTFAAKLQQNFEEQFKKETEDLRKQIFDMRKDYSHIEVTNSELREEVATLEARIGELQVIVKEHEEKERVLQDELRTKEELCQQLEQKCADQTAALECSSLADELCTSPSKRFRRDEVKDLKDATRGLSNALRNLQRYERDLPTHVQFQNVALDVKRLADQFISDDEEEVLSSLEDQVHERLLVFHNTKVESQFYCTVYYPVNRPMPKHMNSD